MQKIQVFTASQTRAALTAFAPGVPTIALKCADGKTEAGEAAAGRGSLLGRHLPAWSWELADMGSSLRSGRALPCASPAGSPPGPPGAWRGTWLTTTVASSWQKPFPFSQRLPGSSRGARSSSGSWGVQAASPPPPGPGLFCSHLAASPCLHIEQMPAPDGRRLLLFPALDA